MHTRGRIVIFAAGTEGDVRPFLALGQGLAASGQEVVLATGADCAARARALGLEFAPLSNNVRALAERFPGMLDGRIQLGMMRVLLSEMRRLARNWAEEGLAAARGATLIIGSGNVALVGASVAEKLGVPFVAASVQPFEPSRDLPPVMLKPANRPGFVNLALHHLTRAMLWQSGRRSMNIVRGNLGLAPYSWSGPWERPYGYGAPTLYGFSPHVLPVQPEWPARFSVMGFYRLAEAGRYEPPPALAQFLAAGPPPAYIGFGSMVSGREGEIGRIVAEALRMSGMRAVLARGWMGLGKSLGDNPAICQVGDVPHDWLFPRMALAVHHCGAGTMAAAVQAGIPSIPVPFAGDQFFNAWQLRRLGVAAPALDRRKLTADRLAAALREAAAAPMRERAAALGALTRNEDGVAASIAQLEAWGFIRT